MTMTDDTTSRVEGFVDELNGAVRDNPVAAGLIGVGVALMLFGGRKALGSIPGAVQSAATKIGAAATAATDMAFGTGEAEGTEASQSVPNATKAYDAVVQAGASIRDSGREYGSTLQAKLADSLDKQPLLLGALGLAIGAGIASTFASTEIEAQVMGAQGKAAREKFYDLADETTKLAQKVVSDVKDEASKQGLSADNAMDALTGIAGKVGNVAGAAKESIANRAGAALRK